MMVFFLLFLTQICLSSQVSGNVDQEHSQEIWRTVRKELYEDDRGRNSVEFQFDTMNKTNSVASSGQQKLNIQMPGVVPSKTDTYLCVSHRLPSYDGYLVGYQPLAKMQVAHHMLLFACDVPFERKEVWKCSDWPECSGEQTSIVYAWGRNAPSLKLPRDVGFHVGGGTGYKYLVLQVHYLDVSSFKDGARDTSGVRVTSDSRKKKYIAGIYDLAANYAVIPPHKPKFHVDTGCKYEEGPAFKPFGFRVHAHSLGAVITGYHVRDNEWTLIGRGDPQRPQAFYNTSSEITVKPGDTLMARCTYNSVKRDRETKIGSTHNDEMCNFYIMYYYDPNSGKGPIMSCEGPDMKLFQGFPESSDITLAELENK